MRIRPATVDDAAAIAAVHVASWRSGYRGLLPDALLDAQDVGRYTRGWTALLTEGPGSALVAEDDGVVVGFVHVAPSRDDDAPPTTGEVTTVYLHPDAWGRGWGRALLVAGQDVLRAGGCDAATLWVLADNARARRSYTTAGWRADGAGRVSERGGRSVTEVRLRVGLDGGCG